MKNVKIFNKADAGDVRAGASNRGIALISALLVVAVAVSLSIAVISRQQVDIRRSANIINGDQAILYAYAVETWAAEVLSEDSRKVDHRGENWAAKIAPIKVGEGVVSGRLEDLQGRFNINNLVLDKTNGKLQKAVLQRLMRKLEIKPVRIGPLIEALTHWIDRDDDIVKGDDSEDYEYLNAKLAYRSANQPMVCPSEILLVKGCDYETWEKLKPHVTALPSFTPVNVNTASPEVLSAMGEDMDDGLVEEMVRRRRTKHFKSTADFFKECRKSLGKPLKANQGLFTVRSGYFKLSASAEFGRGKVKLESILRREGKIVKPIFRSMGEL